MFRTFAITAAALTLGIVAAPAAAALPGGNGQLAFDTDRDGNNELYKSNADGSGATNLSTHLNFDETPVWSPDGTRIAFTSERDGNSEIYTASADGTGVTRITTNAVYDGYPAWSPDGTRIALTSLRDGNYEIYTMNPDGSGATRLTNSGGTDYQSSWSRTAPGSRSRASATATSRSTP